MSSNIYDKEQKKLIPFAGNSEATAGSLDGLSDVNISSPTDGQVLTYDAENQVWKNGAGATVIESLGDIADVDLTDLEDGQTIIWDAVEQKWIPGESGSDYLAGFGIDIDANNRVKTTDFVGTQAEWDALTATEKEAYDFVHITDDASDVNYSPGHAISDGTSEKTQREVLEFNGFDVTDDSVNGKTKIAEVPYTAGRGVAITNKEVAVDETIATTFTGTQAEWNALTATEKAKYNLVNITDDVASGAQVVVDEVTEGNMNAVTSNAVYNSLNRYTWLNYTVPDNTTWHDAFKNASALLNRTYKDCIISVNTAPFYGCQMFGSFGNGTDSITGWMPTNGGMRGFAFNSTYVFEEDLANTPLHTNITSNIAPSGTVITILYRDLEAN